MGTQQVQLPGLHCFWYLVQIAQTGTISLPFSVHSQFVAWSDMPDQVNSMSCMCVQGTDPFRKKWERHGKRHTGPCSPVFWKLCSAMLICELWSAR